MDSKGKKQSASQDGGHHSSHSAAAESEFVRKFKMRPFVFIGTVLVLIIVVVAFVLVPAIVPEAAQSGADLNFGSYNKIPINYVPGNYFAQVQRSMAQNMQDSMNENNSFLVTYQIWRQAFEEATVRIAVLDEVNRAGYTVPAELVDRRVAQQPEFQENGRFSPVKYRQLDNAIRMSLWREMQSSLALERYQNDITGLRISSKEADFVAAMASPQRRFDLVAFPFSAYPDQEIIAYVGDNPGLFRITHLSKITINSSEAEAQRVLDSIKNGEAAFEDAAKTHSQDSYADRGGDLGPKMVYELTNEVSSTEERDALAELAAGDYSPVYKTDSGWAFFRSEEAVYPTDTADSATLDKLRNYVMEYERGRVEDWVFDQAESFVGLAQDNGFDAAASVQGLEKKSFGPLAINYGERQGGYGGSSADGVDLFTTLSSFSINELYIAAAMDNFWQTAFFTPIETPSNPLVIGDNVVILYPVEEIQAETETIDSIKAQYSGYWVSYNISLSLKPFFLRSKKFQDHFMQTFQKVYQF
jgi:hypothetical protein